MVNSQEIIERSLYSAILNTAVALNYSLDPNDFLPISKENKDKFDKAKAALTKYVGIFGTSNNQSKDSKLTPRIVVNAKGFYPGAIGLPKQLIEKSEGIGFTAIEEPYETIDQFINIHLVANNQEDMRLLHQILFFSLPQRGYLKPYTEDKFLFSGNIFMELVNFYDSPNLMVGLIEKVYEFQVADCIISEKVGTADLVPISDISLLIDPYNIQNSIEINVPE